MKPFLYLLLWAAVPLAASAQCLTDFTKLLPEPSIDHTTDFGRSISMNGDHLVVGVPNSDSLGRLTGIVRIYQKISGAWKQIASLAPSDPRDALQFGAAVKMSEDYILVSASGYKGKVYLYKKPAGGWTSRTELTSFTVANSQMFGAGYRDPIAIADDQQTIAITDPYFVVTADRKYSGAVFIYHKQPHQEWSGAMTPVMISAPELDAMDFGRSGVAIRGDRVVTGTPYAPTGNGRLYVYRDPSGEFLNLLPEAKLSAGSSANSAGLGYSNIVFTAEGIFTTAGVDLATDARTVVVFFEMPSSGSWTDVDYTCAIDAHGPLVEGYTTPIIAADGQDIYVSSIAMDGKGYLTAIKKGATGWCDATHETVDTFTPSAGQFTNSYGVVSAASQNMHVAVGFVPHPESNQAQLALEVLSKEPDNTWSSQLIYPARKSTAGHYYGRDILGFEDYLFVGAPYDGTTRSNGGAVYIYKKNGATWEKKGKLLPTLKNRYDDVFGTALATNGTHLAVGAAGFHEHGRVFIYRKNSDWSDLQLVQEIILPEDVLTVYAYGDNVAMSDNWLAIPYVQNSPARIMLALYKFNGTDWTYSQVVEIGLANFFAKSSTLAVDIENETILAANVIVELNTTTGLWEKRYVLSTSDPESIQISPDFTHWITNGSMFGHQVDISGNSIFISAPTKDYGSTWDVGAIYVYTKKPWEAWSSRTETSKILPRVKDELELFGYSFRVLDNTLIAGAPGADFNKDGVTARNKPGRAYVFQTKDYFWNEVEPVLDFTGDSFVKDYFGMAVNLDETDFFIAAPIEDIEDARLSGSVYVTPTPPIIRLVPPVCSNVASIDLFGYPFGGSWSGPGIIDPAEGTFDPKAAGIGTHEFTYTTPSCTYQGKLKVTVEAPVDAKLTTGQEQWVCEGTSFISVPLSVQEQHNASYLWYFREKTTDPFFPLNQKQASMTATQRGEYRVKLYTEACEALSPVMSVKNEKVTLVPEPIGMICQDISGGIALSASPSGGIWTGPGVASGKLDTKNLSNGKYALTYQYTSPLKCAYKATVPIEIQRIPVPSIKRSAGDLCVEGKVTLEVSSSPTPGIRYDWQKKNDAVDLSFIGQGTSISVSERGEYLLSGDNGTCTVQSNVIAVNDNSLTVRMTPEGSDLRSCQGDKVMLSVDAAPGRTYQWFYAGTPEEEAVLQNDVVGNSYDAEKNGHYWAVVRSGICEAETPRKSVTILPAEEIFVPNVFTPNGDGINDVFGVKSNQEHVNLRVINRYGREIFSGNPETGWDGGDAPSGVYYWNASYKACSGEVQKFKGTLHLVR